MELNFFQSIDIMGLYYSLNNKNNDIEIRTIVAEEESMRRTIFARQEAERISMCNHIAIMRQNREYYFNEYIS